MVQQLKPNTILHGDVMEKIAEIPDESIDCIITSPPYWGLRDYKVDNAWGLEKTFEEWLEKMLKLTLELKRVLKQTGTCWIDVGDAYDEKDLIMMPEQLALGMKKQDWRLRNKIIWHKPNSMPASVRDRLKNSYEVVYLFVKNKKYYFDLDAIRVPAKTQSITRASYGWNAPERIGETEDFKQSSMSAKQKGWHDWWAKNPEKQKDYQKKLKQDNVPSKNEGFNQRWKELQENKYGDDPNNLARKQAFYNESMKWKKETKHESASHNINTNYEHGSNIAGANPGDVWTIATAPFKESHFATFPPKLIEPMILAGCPKQICSKCNFIRERIVKPTEEYQKYLGKSFHPHEDDEQYGYGKSITISRTGKHQGTTKYRNEMSDEEWARMPKLETIGWTSCSCNAGWQSGICLDPFIGSGTVAVVAQRLNRNWIGIELKSEYIKLAMDRIYKKSTPITNYQ